MSAEVDRRSIHSLGELQYPDVAPQPAPIPITHGNKYCDLTKRADQIAAAGFSSTQRLSIPGSWVMGYLSRRGITKEMLDQGTAALVDIPKNTALQPDELSFLRELSGALGSATALYLRSSGAADSSGNGRYHSELVFQNATDEDWGRALWKVVRSSLLPTSTSAPGTSYSFAMMLEPVIGNIYEVRETAGFFGDTAPLTLYAPGFSGFAYSQSATGPGPFLKLVPGLCANMIRNPMMGLCLLPDSQKILDYTIEEGIGHCGDCDVIAAMPVESARFRVDNFSSSDYLGLLGDKPNFERFFAMLQELERQCGKPQYIEWACARDNRGEWQFYVTQISDFTVTSFPMEGDLGMYRSCRLIPGEVVGSGEKRGDKIFYLNIFDLSTHAQNVRLQELRAFNAMAEQQGEAYLLLFDRAAIRGQAKLLADDFSAAAVALEIPDGIDHLRKASGSVLEGHFGGAIRQSGKIVATLSDTQENFQNLQELLDRLDETFDRRMSPRSGDELFSECPEIKWLARATEKGQQFILALAEEPQEGGED